jgi:hypothetical protein
MEIQRRVLKDGAVRWRVRWRQSGRYRVQTFDRKGREATRERLRATLRS